MDLPVSKRELNRHRWFEHVLNWQHSGLTQKTFCQQQQLVLASFQRWRGLVTKGTQPASPLAFLPVHLTEHSNSSLTLLRGMSVCRTNQSLRLRAGCSRCDHTLTMPHSCGHRHCPHCQNHESQQWLKNQLQKRVPAEYFLLTFTLPAEFRPLAWCHQRQLYALMI